MLGKRTHSGSYPWKALGRCCLKEAARTTDWIKLGSQVCNQRQVKDPEGNIMWVDVPAAQGYKWKQSEHEFTEIQGGSEC
eukprot:15146129-Heterocapsa_arctica.AAC.1